MDESRTQTQPKNSLDELKEKKISKLILQYAIPNIIGTTVFALYVIILQIFATNTPGLGVYAVGAIGICLPVIGLIFAISLLTGIGAASNISICLGKGDKKAACDLLGNMVTLSVIISLVFTLLFFLFFEPVLRLIGTTKESYPYVNDFLSVFITGCVITILTVCLNHTIRASGYPKKAMLLSVFGLVLSIIVIPVFFFILKTGIKGAAFAMVLCQLLVLIPTLRHFLTKGKTVSFQLQSFKLKPSVVKSIIKIGISPFTVNSIVSLVAFVLNNRLMTYGGADSIASYTIANTLLTFIIMIMLGLTQGVQPVIGYNYGAKKPERVLEALKITGGAGISIGLISLIIIYLFSYQWASLFSPGNKSIAAETVRCFYILSLGLPLSGFQLTVTSFFQSIGSAGKAFMLSATRQLVFLIPAVIIFPLFWQTSGVWYSIPFSDVLSTLLATVILVFHLKRIVNKNR
jgi:putative MATE family efflux protein